MVSKKICQITVGKSCLFACTLLITQFGAANDQFWSLSPTYQGLQSIKTNVHEREELRFKSIRYSFKIFGPSEIESLEFTADNRVFLRRSEGLKRVLPFDRCHCCADSSRPAHPPLLHPIYEDFGDPLAKLDVVTAATPLPTITTWRKQLGV